MASPFVDSFHQSTNGSWNAQLSCCNCGRWIDTGGVKSIGSTSKPSDVLEELSGVTLSEDLAFGMPSDVQKRELTSMAWHNYCTSCRGIVCSICVSVALDAMACPQCLSLHSVASGNTSSLSLPTNLSSSRSSQTISSTLSTPNLSMSAVFANRCKKCSSCPSCNSPALGLRSLHVKEAPESLRKIFFSSPVPAAASTVPSSSSIPQSISFYYCSFCRWSSIDLPASSSSTLSLSSSSSALSTSHLLFSDSTAKLISRSMQIERERSDKGQFQALVEQRRQALTQPAADTSEFLSSASLKSKTWSQEGSSNISPMKKPTKSHSRTISGDRRSTSPVVVPPSPSASQTLAAQSPLLHMISTKRHALEERINHPMRSKFESRAKSENVEVIQPNFPVSYSSLEMQSLERERQGLDEAWKTIQENPLHYFRPASRDPIAPLHSRLSATSLTPHRLHNSHSPIAVHHKESMVEPASSTPTIPTTPHPERIPLFPVCTKKCMKCERVLIKPTCEGHQLGPSSSADPNAYSALPDFKRRHTALNFAPSIEIKAANAYEDYKPSLQLDEWNMLSITISNPPILPAIHITLSSDFDAEKEKPSDESDESLEKTAPSESDEKPAADGDDSSPSQLSRPPSDSTPMGKSKSTTGTESSHSSALPSSTLPATVVAPICQVDCNGCETWILEDEPINLDDDDLGEDEDGNPIQSEKPDMSWLSHPGVPSHLSLLESDTENPAISGRKSRQVTLVVLVFPDGKRFREALQDFKASRPNSASQSDYIPPITCQMQIKVTWPAPTPEEPAKRNELTSLLRINLSNVFDKPDLS